MVLRIFPFKSTTFTLTKSGVSVISFRIINTQQVVEAVAYPNPADAFVWFRVVVSGSEKPDFVSVKVVDLNGKILKTIDQTARVGTNEVFWKDLNLPNGTYIYKFSVQKNGQELPVADGQKMSGKVVVLR